MDWQYNYKPGMSLWRYTYVDVDGYTLFQFESYIRRTLQELEEIFPEHDDILMEVVQEDD